MSKNAPPEKRGKIANILNIFQELDRQKIADAGFVLPQMPSVLLHRNVCFMSAYKQDLPRAENVRRQQELYSDISDCSLGYVPVKGFSTCPLGNEESEDEGCIIFGTFIDEKLFIQLMLAFKKKYDSEAVALMVKRSDNVLLYKGNNDIQNLGCLTFDLMVESFSLLKPVKYQFREIEIDRKYDEYRGNWISHLGHDLKRRKFVREHTESTEFDALGFYLKIKNNPQSAKGWFQIVESGSGK